MKGWALVAFLSALPFVLGYVGWALKKGIKPELSQATHLLVGVMGVVASIRLFGFTVAEDLSVLVAAQKDAGIWALTADDAIFIAVGALAMAWVSVQSAYQAFNAVRNAEK